MKRVPLHLVAVLCVFVASSASAQVARVFLAGIGNDAGDCTNQATPCRSLQGAVTACPVDGEIIILDNGGYGGATITKSLTVNASAGVVAFIARTITVNIGATATDKVVLRGLSMNGIVFGDYNGIAFNGGGTLVVENSVIAGFVNAINQFAAGSNLIVNNCEFRDGIRGVFTSTASDTNTNAIIENSRFEYTNYGVIVESGTANVSIRNSVMTNNGGAGVYATTSSGTRPVLIVVDTCTIAHNSKGTQAQGYNGATATIRVTNSTIYHNVDGMFITGNSAAIESYGNNRVLANTNSSTFSGTVLALQ